MNDFIFITDLHLQVSNNVRTGNYLEDACTKLRWVVDYANSNDARIIIGGDVFHKPSVPDLVKNAVIPVLKSAIYPPLSINGNHDVLFNSSDYNYKTSYMLLCSAGVLDDMTESTIITPNVVITNQVPIVQQGKPQIVIYHGFLNQDDGKWTFRYDDIAAGVTDQIVVCLGHDHVEYEPLKFSENIKYIRPGSFMRVTREDASFRQPKIVHIRYKDDRLYTKLVEIPVARKAEEVFTSKQKTITKAQQKDTYNEIINQLKNANVQNMSFPDALRTVTTETVCNYVFKSVEEFRNNNQFKSKNL